MQAGRKEYRVTVTIKNDLLLSAIEDAGYKNVAQFARTCKLGPSELGLYVNLKQSAIRETGEIRDSVIRICEVLNKRPDELFPEAAMYGELPTNEINISLSGAEANDLFCDGPESLFGQLEVKKSVERLIDSLGNRERQIIDLRFGIRGPEHTLEELAKKFDVSVERVRQIEQKALRLMRHPIRQWKSGLEDALRK